MSPPVCGLEGLEEVLSMLLFLELMLLLLLLLLFGLAFEFEFDVLTSCDSVMLEPGDDGIFGLGTGRW